MFEGMPREPVTSSRKKLQSKPPKPFELDELGPWVWTREEVFRFEGRLYHQLERYFVTNVPAFDPRPRVIDVEEAKTFDGLRWWAPGELQATAEECAPADLPALVEQLIEQGLPSTLWRWVFDPIREDYPSGRVQDRLTMMAALNLWHRTHHFGEAAWEKRYVRYHPDMEVTF